jgi:preprotein translocase subunit YajC
MMEHLLNFLITTAHAESASLAAASQNGSISFILMFAVFFFLIYFAVWRPQSKRAREQQNLVNALAKGDEVVTAGGILGRIAKISDQYIVLSLANNVDIVMQKTSIVNLLPKGTLKSLE